MKLRNLLKRYRDNEDGNFSVFVAAGFLATFTVMATTLDIMLITKSKARLQLLADASALYAVKSFGTEDDKKQAFRDYLEAASATNRDGAFTVGDINVVENDGRVVLTANVKAPVKLTLLQNIVTIDSVGAITQAEAGIQDIEVALVLDISSSMEGARIVEAQRAATAFVEQILDDENLEDRVSVSLVPFGGTVRLPVELVNLVNLPEEGDDEDNFFNHWIDGRWNQCLEYTAEQVEDGIDQDITYAPTPDFWSWNRDNPWCPRAGNEFVPLTDDVDLLIERIDSLTLSDGTGSDHGVLWGFETLNHEWIDAMPGGLAGTPARNDNSSKKVMIFMSDGGITAQHHVREEDRFGDVPYNSGKRILPGYNFNAAKDAYFEACDRAKDNNVVVYTIGFQLRNNKQRNQITACATSASHYIDAASGDLEGIFTGLANTISPVRLSN